MSSERPPSETSPRFVARAVLMDIEGTTTSIRFVHDLLFPFARARMSAFIRENIDGDEIKSALSEVQETLSAEGESAPSIERAIEALHLWIDQDRKHGTLKRLQGMIWRAGYEDGTLCAHLYDDVLPALERWTAAGLLLAIYSSGSTRAQKLLFGYTEHGDLTPLLSGYFDTRVGHKREMASYREICEQLNLSADEILFLSDVPQELDAAHLAGMQVIQLERQKIERGDHLIVSSFDDFVVDLRA